MEDTVTDLPFPTSGVFAAGEYGAPPGMTAVKGVNCRGFDPIARRLRGGSRPGLTKFLPVATPAGTHLIQHLDAIVDPTVDALLPDYPDGLPAGSLTADPTESARNPFGRSVRTGGSGTPILKNKPVPAGRFVQAESTFVSNTSLGVSTSTGTVAFDADVTAGNLVVVCVRYNTGLSNTPTFDAANVTDTAGTTYAKAVEAAHPTVGPTAAVIFYGIVPVTGSGPNTVSVTVTTDGSDVGEFNIDILEYRRVAQSSPLAGSAGDAGQFSWAGDYTLSPGDVATTRDDSIIVAVLSQAGVGGGSADIGPAPAFDSDPQPHQRGFGSGSQELRGKEVFDLFPVGSSAIGLAPTYTAHPTGTPSGTIFWAMVAASFSPP